jgi:hypothetical protein
MPHADRIISHNPLQEHGYRNTKQMVKSEGTEELEYSTYPVQLQLGISSQSSKEPFSQCKEA